jgi:hypothetical protein
MNVPMKALFLAGMLAVTSSHALAQTPGPAASQPSQPARPAEGDPRLATRTGHELNIGFGHYDYVEPGEHHISIHGPKIGGEYSGTLPLDGRRRWFATGNVRGTGGSVTYDGWCAPFLITPNGSSPNGYQLDIGDYSPCSESGDVDWYVDARALIARDFVATNWGVSPETGLGVRHLSNGTTGAVGYRTDDYLYLPLGVTARTRIASRSALSLKLEFDALLHGWQTTRESKLGSGDVPATPTAPAFTINGFTDLSFDQHSGWGLRTTAKYQVTNRWSVEPSYVRWSISGSTIGDETVTFTVNGISAREQLGAYEPVNVTNEFFVNLGFHF